MSSAGSRDWTWRRRLGRQLAFQFVFERLLNPRAAPVTTAAQPQGAGSGAGVPSREEIEQLARRLETLWSDQTEPSDQLEEDLSRLLADPRARKEAVAFAEKLAAGVFTRCEQIDQCIARAAHHWSLERMAPVDRAILRVGAFELLFGDTPPRVAINEAVELAKRFGGADSGAFVNGILDRLMHEKPGESTGN